MDATQLCEQGITRLIRRASEARPAEGLTRLGVDPGSRLVVYAVDPSEGSADAAGASPCHR